MQSEAGKPKKSAAVPRQAQAQAQEEAIISVTESLELVQCLLRVVSRFLSRSPSFIQQD